mmetsp:Transcript_11842/g.25432  ORF Transcript_11842/g.25432 Transcript_11842/m.25432 type:complete len:216 (+) Transcript_11842:489-1136(+)
MVLKGPAVKLPLCQLALESPNHFLDRAGRTDVSGYICLREARLFKFFRPGQPAGLAAEPLRYRGLCADPLQRHRARQLPVLRALYDRSVAFGALYRQLHHRLQVRLRRPAKVQAGCGTLQGLSLIGAPPGLSTDKILGLKHTVEVVDGLDALKRAAVQRSGCHGMGGSQPEQGALDCCDHNLNHFDWPPLHTSNQDMSAGSDAGSYQTSDGFECC